MAVEPGEPGITPQMKAAIASSAAQSAAAKNAVASSTTGSAGGGGGSGGGTSGTGQPSTQIPTYKQMLATATGQATQAAGTEIQQQVTPLQAQIGYQTTLGTQENQALNNEMAQLLPYSQNAAALTGQFNQQAASDAQAIFQAAGQQLNAQTQNAAAQAQSLAQQTGGPVSSGQFTDTLAPYQAALGQSSSIGQLATLQLGQIGTDEAYQFSGQVLPAMALQQHATIQANIDAQKQQLENQITQIRSTKSQLIDSKLNSYLTAQMNYYKDQASIAEKAWKDKQDVIVANKKVDNANNKLALDAAKQIYDMYFKGQTLTIAGKKYNLENFIQTNKLTLDQVKEYFNEWATGKKLDQTGQKISQAWDNLGIKTTEIQARIDHMSNQDKATAQRLGISAAQLALGQLKLQVTATNDKARTDAANVKNLNSIVSTMIGGSTSNKPMTVTQKQYLDPKDPLAIEAQRYASGGIFQTGKPPANVFFDPNHRYADGTIGGYYTYTKTTMTPSQWATQTGGSGTPITDPNALYRYIINAMPSAGKQTIISAIRLHLGLPTWNPGDPANYTTATLNQMSLPDLTDLAIAHGFPPSPRAVSKQRLIDYIQTALNGKGGTVKTAVTQPVTGATSSKTTVGGTTTNGAATSTLPSSNIWNPYTP